MARRQAAQQLLQALRLCQGQHLLHAAAGAQAPRALALGACLQQQQPQQLQPQLCLQQQQPAWCRSFASKPLDAAGMAVTTTVLKQAQVLKLRTELDEIAQQRAHIPFTEFVQLAQASGATGSVAEAEDLAAQMQRSCLVLRHRDVVYLKPEEIAEAVMTMMPGDHEEAQERLAEVETELAQLKAVHDKLEASAQLRADTMLTVGLIILFTQMVAFIWLTWWELSWDVMEPIAYIISLFYSLCAYTYFMLTRGATFDLGPFRSFWSERILHKNKTKLAFDQERWDYLQRQKARVQRHLNLPRQILKAATKA